MLTPELSNKPIIVIILPNMVVLGNLENVWNKLSCLPSIKKVSGKAV